MLVKPTLYWQQSKSIFGHSTTLGWLTLILFVKLSGKYFPSNIYPVCKSCVACAYGKIRAGKLKKTKHQASVKNAMFMSA